MECELTNIIKSVLLLLHVIKVYLFNSIEFLTSLGNTSWCKKGINMTRLKSRQRFDNWIVLSTIFQLQESLISLDLQISHKRKENLKESDKLQSRF